jgi:hypothetical protein
VTERYPKLHSRLHGGERGRSGVREVLHSRLHGGELSTKSSLFNRNNDFKQL